MSDFISRYFIQPILTGEGYNPFNTLVYAIGFLLAIYLAKIVFEKLEIKINKYWFKSIFLISVVGGLLRASEDWITKNYGVIVPTRFLFVTPGIYFLLAGIVLLVAYLDNEEFYKKMYQVNKGLILILAFFVLAMLLTTGVHNLGQVLLILILGLGIGYAVHRAMLKYNLAIDEDKWMIMGHSLDGFSTAISLSMIPGYFEQHVVTGLLISNTNPFVYPLVKIGLIASVAYVLKRWEENEWAWILRLFLVIIGLGPGTRDTTRVLLGV